MGSNHYGRGFRRGNYSRRGHRGHYQGQRGGSQGEQVIIFLLFFLNCYCWCRISFIIYVNYIVI